MMEALVQSRYPVDGFVSAALFFLVLSLRSRCLPGLGHSRKRSIRKGGLVAGVLLGLLSYFSAVYASTDGRFSTFALL